MARHSVGGNENGEEASVGNSRYLRQRQPRNLNNGGGEGTEDADNIDDANMEHGETNGLVPTVNDLDRPMISPSHALDDSNAIYAIICDTRMLDCCVCSKPLSYPVFQCLDGHITCGTCCHIFRNKCTICFLPNHSRCPAIEKLLESIKIACHNKKYGCNSIVRYSEKYAHEKTCIFEPCSCPQEGCNFFSNSSELVIHFKNNHLLEEPPFKYDAFFTTLLHINKNTVVLQALTDGELFVINNKVEPLGNVLTLCHIGPNKMNPQFDFEMSLESQQGWNSLSLQSKVMNTQCGKPDSSSMFLLVPFEFSQPSGEHEIEIRIRMIGVVQPEGNP
ncbi:Zinc finger, SIAH-type [Sesbania bispinosa]|nr:Zinc finger, SIAH-type [Sesbania bispinosa]